MSWDVVLFNFAGKPPIPPEEMGDDFEPPLLGKADEIRKIISTVFPDTDWSDPEWGILDVGATSIEFNMGEEDDVTDIMLHVRGGGDPVSAILKLCKAAGWTALDCSANRYLEAGNPDANGWGDFVAFRDRASAKPSPPTHCPKCKRTLAKNTGRCMYCG
jgi:hypothetical protein